MYPSRPPRATGSMSPPALIRLPRSHPAVNTAAPRIAEQAYEFTHGQLYCKMSYHPIGPRPAQCANHSNECTFGSSAGDLTTWKDCRRHHHREPFRRTSGSQYTHGLPWAISSRPRVSSAKMAACRIWILSLRLGAFSSRPTSADPGVECCDNEAAYPLGRRCAARA